jgi:hypothetical protein
MSPTKKQPDSAEMNVLKVGQWLGSVPADDDMVTATVVGLLHSRGAFDEQSLVPDVELFGFIDWVKNLHSNVTLLKMLIDGTVTCKPSADDPKEMSWSITDLGVRAVEQHKRIKKGE